MDHDQTAGPAGAAGPAREQTVNETTANQAAQAAASEPAPAAATDPTTQAATGPAAPDPATAPEPAESTAESTTETAAGETTQADATTDAEAAVSSAGPSDGAGAGPFAAELAALRAELDERTSDLQRLSAEYANYRKRVERDRLLVAEQATAQVVTVLLPVLDDLDRAREHGDLVGPFGLVAEQLNAALAKFGLTGFGEVGDVFDPTRHEAVTHQTSAEVTEPTCVTVMRRGYLLGERLLRPALVAVADPE